MSMEALPTSLPADDVAAIDELRQVHERLQRELSRIIVGQKEVVERLAICLFSRGHALLMGVPGLAKTLLVARLAETMALKFSRIQFTPDLMPMDITGTDILQATGEGRRQFEFVPGPVFANIVLADEINRAPSKTQAAMLEAMQEHKVTVLGRTYTLDVPFFVLATQNPHRAGRYLPASGGAARSVHVSDRGRLPYAGGGDRDCPYDNRRRISKVGRCD